jgi:hypothetical protein
MRLKTYGRNFWRQATERAVKTAAQAAALAGVGLSSNVLDLDVWQALGAGALGGFVLSIVTSIATAPVGAGDDPSLVPPTDEHVEAVAAEIDADGRPLH